MKIAYLFTLDPALSTGVFKKIKSQIRHWQAAGHTVRAFHVRPVTSEFDSSSLSDLEENWQSYVRPLGLSGIVDRVNTWRALADDVIEWGPDVAYYRYSRFWPGLGRLARNVPTVAELNTVEREYYGRARKWYYYHRATKPYFFRQLAGIVCVTREICREYSGRGYPDERRVIANGIDLGEYEVLPPSYSETPELVFIGHGNPWDGIPKILKLATIRPRWTFHIIGDIEEPGDAPKNVHFHGYLERSDYERLFERADAGIGTLALYEKDMTEASPLKVREYLAYGLPVIVGYDDTDFQDDQPFLLQLPNHADNIETEIERIAEFVERWHGRRVPRQSVQHIDARRKEDARLDFFEAVIRSER